LTGDELFQFETRISRKAKSKARPSVLIKTKAGFFSLKRGYLVVKAKSKESLSVLMKTKAEQQHLWLLRSSVCLFKEGGWHYY
jgi:hypothetical protein